jgi:hypothetical protein
MKITCHDDAALLIKKQEIFSLDESALNLVEICRVRFRPRQPVSALKRRLPTTVNMSRKRSGQPPEQKYNEGGERRGRNENDQTKSYQSA